MPSMYFLLCGLSLQLLVGVVAGPAGAEAAPAVEGFGDARFGMSPTQVGQVVPKLEEVALRPATAADATATPLPFPLRQFLAKGLPVADIGPCNVYWNFFRDKLSKIDFYCPDKAKVEAYLGQQFGTPRKELGQNRIWGDEVVVVYSIPLGSYSYIHRAMNDAMQAEMLRLYAPPGAAAPPAAR